MRLPLSPLTPGESHHGSFNAIPLEYGLEPPEVRLGFLSRRDNRLAAATRADGCHLTPTMPNRGHLQQLYCTLFWQSISNLSTEIRFKAEHFQSFALL